MPGQNQSVFGNNNPFWEGLKKRATEVKQNIGGFFSNLRAENRATGSGLLGMATKPKPAPAPAAQGAPTGHGSAMEQAALELANNGADIPAPAPSPAPSPAPASANPLADLGLTKPTNEDPAKPVSFLDTLKQDPMYKETAGKQMERVYNEGQTEFGIPQLQEAKTTATKGIETAKQQVRDKYLPDFQANTTEISNLRNELNTARQSGAGFQELGGIAARLNETIARRSNLENEFSTNKLDKVGDAELAFEVADDNLKNAMERMLTKISLQTSGFQMDRTEQISAIKDVEDKLTKAQDAADAKNKQQFSDVKSFLKDLGYTVNPQTYQVVKIPKEAAAGSNYQFKEINGKAYAFDPVDPSKTFAIEGIGGGEQNVKLLNDAVSDKTGFGKILSGQNPNVEQLAQIAFDGGADFTGFLGAIQTNPKIEIKPDGRIVDHRGIDKTIGYIDYENENVSKNKPQ